MENSRFAQRKPRNYLNIIITRREADNHNIINECYNHNLKKPQRNTQMGNKQKNQPNTE